MSEPLGVIAYNPRIGQWFGIAQNVISCPLEHHNYRKSLIRRQWIRAFEWTNEVDMTANCS